MPNSLRKLRKNYTTAQISFDGAVAKFKAESDALAAAQAALTKAGDELNQAFDGVRDTGVLLRRAGDTTQIVVLTELQMFNAISQGREAGDLHADLESLRPKNAESC